MEKISEFLINHWIIVLIVNTIAIVFIIGYLIEQSKKKKTIKEEKIIFDNTKQKLDENIIDNNKILADTPLENINNEIIDNKIENESNINDENIQTISEDTKQQLQDNIDKIINQSNSVFEEFDKVIPDEKIIPDELKEKLETFDKIEPIKETKKSVYIDTDIKLPEITLSTKEEDIWA